jgi:hypothetical protein
MTDDTKQRAMELNDALSANFMAVDISLRSYSGKTTDNAVSAEVIQNKGAARDSGKFVKNLFVGADAELKHVNTLGNAVRALVYARTIPLSNNSDGAKRGSRLINATKSLELLREIAAPVKEYNEAVDKLVEVYDYRVQEGLSNLNGMGRAEDYPDKNQIKALFAISIDLVPVPSISDFTRVNVPSALAVALGQRYADRAEAMLANGMADLKERLLKELQRMAKMLGKAGAGDKTRLYDSLVTNLQDLVSLTRSMNVMNNPELNKLADDIEKQLLQHPVEVYRLHPSKAAEVAQAAQSLAVDAALDEIWK